MERLACVDLPALSLQLLLLEHPDWRGEAVAVVAEDRPQGRILQVNETARRRGVLPGMSYAAGLSLAPQLRARVVAAGRVDEAVRAMATRLRRFSPRVEPCTQEPGVFWLDVAGLDLLYETQQQWAEEVAADLRGDGFVVGLAVGFSRFGTYAVARGWRGIHVHTDPEAEREAAGAVPLQRLGMEPAMRDALLRLGVRTVAELVALPADGVQRRFGEQARRLWRLAAGHWRPRLRPLAEELPVEASEHLDEGEQDAIRLLFLLKRLLLPIQRRLSASRQVMAALHLHLQLEDGTSLHEHLKPAEPTGRMEILQDLLRLRLEALALPAPVSDIHLRVEVTAPGHEQERLAFARPRRDLDAVALALARLRAELGEDAVLRARLCAGHLPEASHRWERLERLPAPAPRRVEQRPLVRRLLRRPRPLPPQSRHVRDDGWLVQGLAQGSVVRVFGPYLVSGGWWVREVHREYQFAETQRGDVLWIFYDRHRRRWFLQGLVE